MRKYHVICRSSHYDQDNSMLVLICFFKDLGVLRFVHMSRDDFNYRGNEAPHIEMHRMAEAFKGKPFWLEIRSDPSIPEMTDEESIKIGSEIQTKMFDELDAVTKGLADPERIMARRLGDVVEKEQKKQQSVEDIIVNEMSIRAKIKGQ